MKYKLIIYVFLVFLTFNLVSAGWWNSSYTYRRNITDDTSSYDLAMSINGTAGFNNSIIWFNPSQIGGTSQLYYEDSSFYSVANETDPAYFEGEGSDQNNTPVSVYSSDAIGVFHFSNNCLDSSSEGNDGSCSNIAYNNSVFGTGLDATSSSKVVDISAVANDLSEGQAWSISFWVLDTDEWVDTGDNRQVINMYYDGDYRWRVMFDDGSDDLEFQSKYGSTNFVAKNIDVANANIDTAGYNHFVLVSDNVDNARLYINNKSILNLTNRLYSGFAASGDLFLGHYYTGIQDMAAYYDEVRVFDRELTRSEISVLYGNWKGSNNLLGSEETGNTPPVMNITSPVNNTHNNQPLFINFTYSDPEGDSGNCTVYINNSDEKKTFVSITNNTWRNYTSNMSVDGNYYFYVNCTDNNSNDVRSGNYYFTYDTISPQITWINPTNNDTLLSLSNNTFNIIINFSDTNLYKTLINITNSFGVSKWYDYTENISGVNDFHNHTINISSWGIGKYTIRAEAVDDHTFGPLRGLSYSFSEGKLTLSKGGWEKDILVGYYLNGDYSLLSSQQIRNYDVSFSAGIVNNEIKFNLSFTRPVVDVKFGFAIPKRGLVIRNKSKGHFVWKDWYIDFSDMLSDGFLIKFLETKDYYVIYTSTEYCGSAVGETCVFDPLIGGLNNISSERYFVIDTPAVVNFVNITPSTAYYYDDLTCDFSAYHSLNDINISAYWLVNNSVVWGVNLTNASDNVTYNITLNSSLVEPNSNIYCYVNVTDGYVLQSNYSNITVGDLPPNITSWYPQNLSFNISEGVNQSFNVTVFDDAGVVWYKWLLDGIVTVFTQVWDWITGYESSGVHNVTVVVNDTSNQTDMKTWSVTVSNVNIAPVVNALSSSETVVYQNYPNVTIYCNTTDEDTAVENLTVHIQFRDSDDLLWRDTSESYSGGLWFSTFDPDNVDLGLVDIRCKANDGDLDSDWYTLNNHIIVYEAQYPPTTPTELMPTGGEFDYSIIVTCSGATDNNTAQKIYYLIEYSVEGGSWSLLSNNTAGIGFFDMAEHMEYNETADFRCMAVDSEGWNSSWYNPSGDISRNRTIDLFLFEPSYNSYYVAYTPKQLGVHGSVRGLSNISIISTFMDCNGDGIWDYFVDNTSGWDVNGSVQEFDEYYWCMFKPGVIYIEIGMTLAKQSDMDWPGSLGVCSNSISDECRLVRQYPVWVRY